MVRLFSRLQSVLRREQAIKFHLDAELLEERILLSAVPVIDTVDTIDSALDAIESLFENKEEGIETAPYSDDQVVLSIDPTGVEQINAQSNPRSELVIVDASNQNYQQFVDDLTRQRSDGIQVDVYLLDETQNGIEQITQILRGYEQLDAIHIISHATPTQIKLGNQWLDRDTLQLQSAEVSQWSHSMSDSADLLLYGCNLAASEAGLSLLESLAAICECDVAASDDNTGSVHLGGDWEFEFTIGDIETDNALSQSFCENWHAILAFQTFRDEFNTASFSNSDGTEDWTGNSWQEIGESNGETAGRVRIETLFGQQGLTIKGLGFGIQREVSLSGADVATLTFDYAAIELDDANDYIVLEISTNGGGSWTEIKRFVGAANDTSIKSTSIDISDYISNSVQFRFLANVNSVSEGLFVDDIQIAYSNEFTVTGELLVNASTSGIQETSGALRGGHQSVASAPDGTYIVVWSDQNADGNGWGVVAQRFSASGTAIGSSFLANNTVSGDQNNASVAVDGQGSFVIAWTGENSGNKDVYLRRFNADGSAIDSADIRVNGVDSNDQESVSLSINNTGSMAIAWQSVGASQGVYVKLFDMTSSAPGNLITSSDIVVDSNSGSVNPSVDINDDGKFVVVWQKGNEPFAQRFDADGNARGSQIDINPWISSTLEQHAVVAIQTSGDFVVAYRTEIGFFEGIYAKRYRDDGTAYALATKVSSGNSHVAPSISMDSNGNYMIVYQGDGDGNGDGVFGRIYSAAGTAQGSQFQVNQSSDNDQAMASVSMASLNSYVVVWSGNGTQSGNLDDSGVFVRQFGGIIANAPLDTIEDINNNTDTVLENASLGDSVGITIRAVDLDAGDTITYSLDDDAGGRFAINSSTGTVSVLSGSLLNREAATSHNITVRATSSDSTFLTAMFSIALDDIDEFDVGAVSDTNGSNNEISENAANGSAVGITASATDSDATNNAIIYSLDDSAGGRFAIHSTSGIVTVANSSLLDREAFATHSIIIRANSSDGSTSTATMTINVGDIDEFNVGAISDIDAADDEILENAADRTIVGITVQASDADSTDNSITYSLIDDAGGRFAIHSDSGVVTVANGALIDRETSYSYYIMVQATSSDGSSNTQSFSINVRAVEELEVSPPPEVDPIVEEDAGLSLVLSNRPSDANGPPSSHDSENTNRLENNVQDSVSTIVSDTSANLVPVISAQTPDTTADLSILSIESVDQESLTSQTATTVATTSVSEFDGTMEESNERLDTRTGRLDRHLSASLVSGTIRTSMQTQQLVVSFASLQTQSLDTMSFEPLVASSLIWNDLDRVKEQLESFDTPAQMVFGTATGIASSLSVGYVVWLLRGGYIVAGVMAQLPAWRLIDPLPILAQLEATGDDEQDDSLITMINRSNTEDESAPHTEDTKTSSSLTNS